MSVVVGVVRESEPRERRVALVPESVCRLRDLGCEVIVQAGAGARACYRDEDYIAAGATVVRARELFRRSDVVVRVSPPTSDEVDPLGWGRMVIGMLRPWDLPTLHRDWAECGVTVVSIDLMAGLGGPLDAVSSQDAVGGYKAAIRAADLFGGFFPGTQEAGVLEPARVLVVGAGAAGLAVIRTARRLGAVVLACDTDRERSLAASGLGACTVPMAGFEHRGEWASSLTAAEQQAVREVLAPHIRNSDVVVTTVESAVPRHPCSSRPRWSPRCGRVPWSST